MDDQKEISLKRDESINVNELMGIANRSSEEQSDDTKIHGDYVDLDDGEVGIVVDLDHEKNKLINSVKNEKLEALIDESVPTYDKLGTGSNESQVDYGSMILQKLPDSDYARSIMEVKEKFAGFKPTVNGLAQEDSDQAIQYERAMEALRSGEYILPTVEQYNQQKLEIQRRKEQEAQNKMEEQNNIQTPEVHEQKVVINLAAMEEQANTVNTNYISEQQLEQVGQTPISAQSISPKEITEFRIPEGKVDEFLDTLTPEERNKVETSKVIEVKEVREVKVPVVTRTITRLDQYKRIAPKRVTSEAVEVPLLNSGYVAIVKGCSSLEMASILPNIEDMEWDDYSKLYAFCYSNLVSASIGSLSYSRFCIKTSPDDLPAMIHAILRASVPDEQSVTLTCGAEKCGKDYDITYSLSDLADLDNVNDEVLKRIDQLMSVKNVVDDARKSSRRISSYDSEAY